MAQIIWYAYYGASISGNDRIISYDPYGYLKRGSNE